MAIVPTTKSTAAASKPAADVFSAKQIAAAKARLPKMSSADVEQLRLRSMARGLTALQAACDAELGRRPFTFSTGQAADFDRMAEAVRDMSLSEATRFAFTQAMPARPEEVVFLRWLAEHPGGLFQDALKAYGKGDLGLVIGHLVYHRYGCFRAFMQEGQDQSSVLLVKDRSAEGVRYRFQPEAEAVFRDMKLIP